MQINIEIQRLRGEAADLHRQQVMKLEVAEGLERALRRSLREESKAAQAIEPVGPVRMLEGGGDDLAPLHQPLVERVRSVLETISVPFRTADVVRALRKEFGLEVSATTVQTYLNRERRVKRMSRGLYATTSHVEAVREHIEDNMQAQSAAGNSK